MSMAEIPNKTFSEELQDPSVLMDYIRSDRWFRIVSWVLLIGWLVISVIGAVAIIGGVR